MRQQQRRTFGLAGAALIGSIMLLTACQAPTPAVVMTNAPRGVCAAAGEDAGAVIAFDWIARGDQDVPVEITNVVLDQPDGLELFGARIVDDVELEGVSSGVGSEESGFLPTELPEQTSVTLRLALELTDPAALGTAQGAWLEGTTASGESFRAHTCLGLQVVPEPDGWAACDSVPDMTDTMEPLCGLVDATP